MVALTNQTSRRQLRSDNTDPSSSHLGPNPSGRPHPRSLVVEVENGIGSPGPTPTDFNLSHGHPLEERSREVPRTIAEVVRAKRQSSLKSSTTNASIRTLPPCYCSTLAVGEVQL